MVTNGTLSAHELNPPIIPISSKPELTAVNEYVLATIFNEISYVPAVTFCSYPKVAISEHFTVNQAETLIEAQSLIEPLNRHFWVGAVGRSAFIFQLIVQERILIQILQLHFLQLRQLSFLSLLSFSLNIPLKLLFR